MSPVLSGGTSHCISPVTWLPWAHQHLSGTGSLTGSHLQGWGPTEVGGEGHGSCGPLVPSTAQLEPSPHSPEPAQPLAGLTSASRVQTQAHWPWPGCPGSRWGAVQENVGGSAHWTHRKEQVRAPLGRWGPAAAGSPGPPEAVQPPGRALAALPSPASRASSSPPLASPGSACPPGFPDKRRPCGFISLPLYLWLPPPAPSVLPFLPRELIHTAWDPTPRPDLPVVLARTAPREQGGRDVAPEPAGRDPPGRWARAVSSLRDGVRDLWRFCPGHIGHSLGTFLVARTRLSWHGASRGQGLCRTPRRTGSSGLGRQERRGWDARHVDVESGAREGRPGPLRTR